MRALLEHAEAQVHLDARREGVVLPDRLRASSNVRLDYGYGLTPPIIDLTVDEKGISATLAFNRVPFATFVPWSAVFLIADFAGRGAVWREDLPPELMVDPAFGGPGGKAPAQRVTERDFLSPPPEPTPAPRRFTVVDDATPPPEGPDPSGRDEPDPPKSSRPTLRLVK
jgi:hypothetical protein